MADLLDRQAVIDLFDKYHPYMGTRVLEYERKLKELPTVNAVPVDTLLVQTIESITKASEAIMNSPLKYIVKEEHDDDLQTNWIPVSEQLPGNDDVVMVTVNDFGNVFVSVDSYVDGEWFSFPKCVTAWIEKPKPYEVKKMALIDKDKLIDRVFTESALLKASGKSHKEIALAMVNAIDEAPIVDAIPVEWIKAFAENNKNHIQDSVNKYTYMYDFLISEWRAGRKEE